MLARFVSVDRDRPMLLPPELRERELEDDEVHFVIQAVDNLPGIQKGNPPKGL